jgi:hypothetical protein
MAHLSNRMRSLAANGNPRAEELIEKADELDKLIDADTWDTEQVLGAWLRARKLGVRSRTSRCSSEHPCVDAMGEQRFVPHVRHDVRP